ncbi:hypothetical protein [Gemmobacter nectariphilus]|uniref:hypothetical protein n=1 Tax=Gemmobacter nectariphilus TaxID=220343 RepID=UPI000417BFCF|nr:hypothetical protein [Gemmobacter nectariphilus]
MNAAVGADERLVVMLEARIRDFEKNLAKADQRGTKTYQNLRRGSQSATRQMEADMVRSTSRINQALATTSTGIGTFAKAFAGGLLGTLAIGGLTEAVGRINQLAEGVAGVGDAARRAGLSAKEFQEWSYVADQNRIGVDALTDGIKELQLRADEFAVTGKGSAAEAFERLGYSAADVASKMKDPSALLLEIMGRVEQLDRAAQIRIFDELLGGTGGERFVELLEQGSRKIADTKREASDLGIVMSDELIAKADQLNRQFNTVANTVGVALKSAIISAASSLSDFLDGFREFENQRDTTLQDRQTAIMGQRADLYAEMNAIRAGGRPDSWGGQVQAIEDTIAELTAEEDRIIAILSSRTERTWAPKADTWAPPATTDPPGKDKPGSGRGKSRLNDLESAIAATERQIAANAAEAQSLHDLVAAGNAYGGSLDYAKKRAELLIAAQKAGIDLTPDQIAGLEDLARAYAESGIAATDAADRMRQVEQASMRGQDAFRDLFGSILEGSASAKQALASLLMQMAKVQFTKGMLGLLGSTSWGTTLVKSVGESLSFDGGGYTGDGTRTGGLDGKGGFMAMLHPRETVTDHTRGQSAPTAAKPQALTVTVTMDPSTAQLGAFVRDQAGRVVASAAPQIVSQSVDATYRQAREVPIG